MFRSNRRKKQQKAEEGVLQSGCPLLWVEHYAEIVPDILADRHGDRISRLCNVTDCDAYRKFVVLSLESLDSPVNSEDVRIHVCAVNDTPVEIH